MSAVLQNLQTMSIGAKEITASFDEAIAELKSLYDVANEVMNSDKGELFLSPLLSEINRLYSLIQHLVIAESDESAKCEIERKLNAQHIVKSRFDKVVNRYLADKKTKFPASMISGPRTLRSRSGVSRHSSASNRFHAEAVAKKEIARLRLSQLQERQEMERQEEERKIDEMRRSVEREIEEKRRSAEHHRKLQILEATHVWNEASLQQQVASEEFEHGGYISDGEIQDATGKSFEETSNAKLSLQSSKVSPEHALEVIIPVEHSTADRGKTASVKNKLTPKGETSVKSIERANTVCDVLQGESGTSSSCNNASIDALQTVIASLKSSVDCPKLELLKFNGNPMAYHRFMMTFAATIESAVPDNRRLLYLLQYCEGKAKELIEHCALLEPSEGYEKAKEILYENYGRRCIIARAYIKKLVKGSVIRSDDSNALIKLAQELEECNTTLRFMKYYSDVNNFDNIAKIVGRLSFSMQSRWLRFAASLEKQDREPSFEDLVGFVKNESEIAKSSYSGVLFKTGKKPGIKISTHATNVTKAKGKFDSRWNNPRSSMPTRKQTEVKCGLCSSNHFLWSCPKFRTMNQESKYKYIRDQRLCFNCLKGGHVQRDCQSQRKCTVSGCGRKHHFLLHRDQPNRQARTPETTSSPNENSTMTPSAEGASESSKCFACATNAKSQAFLNIVPVRISAGKKTVCCFAFLDQGSTTSLCDERLLKELDITGEKTSFTLSTLNNSAAQVGSKVDLMVSSLSDSGNLRLKNVLSVNKLPVRPNQPLKHSGKTCWTHLQKLKIPHLENQEVMLLIGVDTPEAFWIEDELRGKPGEPYAIKTMLGWSLIGPATGEASEISANFMTTDESLEQQVRSMWELERHFSTGIECQMSRNDRYALRIMKDSTVLTEDGHYQLALPWRPGAPQLESNKNQAAVRLAYLKKRLEKDAELQKRYVNVVESYITNGFARRVNEADNEAPGRWFLSHHPVFHPHKPDKVRVVFDCGARHKGKSLNDQLLKGPDLMNNLVGVLSRFRMENVAIVADVEAMFHQVKVDPRDHSYLRFLWWPDGDLSQPFHEYSMQVHLFGVTSSPACTNFCLNQAAIDQADVFSTESVETLQQNFYMDDCLKSVSLEEAEKEIIACMQRSRFEKEISSLSELSKSNPLRKLRPIVHQGLLRVGGRLRNARENFDVKHPIILPSSHHVTRLLIEDHHCLMGHSGMASTWTSLRQRFWIIKGAATVRKILGKCLFCRKRNASPEKQITADLPEGRLSVNNPVFYVTGVDYFGPFEIEQGGSYVKRYGCLFTCLSTRAVHIEVTPSLTADTFFNALLSSQTLTDDLLVTLMTEAESIINSRPLTPILLDPDAEEPLTPNHLLMMRSSTSPPGLFKGTDCYSQKRWRQVQYLADQFWLRFRCEYLQTLQVRQKWHKKEPNFSVNDLVLMYDENAPRGSWPLGKVVEVYPDSQGNVRQVLVRTKTQTFKRPISKLCRLKLESQWADEPK